jgi:PQQ-dependent catabolism-associated CXXCW motif protein
MSGSLKRGLFFGATLMMGAAASSAPPAPPEPSGYRMEDYRSPVPASIQGRPALSTTEAAMLWRAGTALFIDTLPQPPKPAGLPPGTIWNPKPRFDIPGSLWLPDTGYGELPPMMERYFDSNLERATAGDRNHALVFYCLADCWMSWNAAKRAISLGYTHVEWFAAGVDGWVAAKLPLEERQPLPRPTENTR